MYDTPQPKFKDVKPVETSWANFAKGLNTLVSAAKIRDDELSLANNIILVDEGSPVRRWGTANYDGRDADMLFPFYKSDGTNELLRIKDGFLYKDDTLITGASFASGQVTTGVMAYDAVYFSNGIDNLAKYDGTSLAEYTGISAPASNWTTRGASLASGQYIYSYRVSAVNSVGETLACAATTIAVNKKRDLWNTNSSDIIEGNSINVRWNAVTGATGYNIYGYLNGDESYIDHVDGQGVTNYADYGVEEPSSVFLVPAGDTTTGPKGKYILEFKSSLIIAGDLENPTRVHYSAGVDKVDSFLISDGGGYIDIAKNSDDGHIRGLAKYQNNLVVLKERSIWQMDFTDAAIPSLTNVVMGIGCVSHRTITAVENDLFFLGRKIGGGAAIYVLGNEPNYLNVLRTNELSARVRPDLLALSPTNFEKTNAVYYDGKYILFYADGGVSDNNAALLYDRERLGYTKWNAIYSRDVKVFYDTNRNEHLLFADSNDGKITKLDPAYTDDKGAAIEWNYKTKEDDLKDPFLYKKYKDIQLRLRNVAGTIRIAIWTDSTQTAYSRSISTSNLNTAFRNLKFRVGRFRRTIDQNSSSPESVIIRRIPINRIGSAAIAKSIALEVSGSDKDSRATLLDVKIKARPKSKNYYPRTEVIS